MTSKALEAAAKVLAEANYMIPWDEMDSVDRLEVLDICTNMIRAFADNLSEEAAKEFYVPVTFSDGSVVNIPASVTQLRAAIARDLE